tara:strand:+ start:570 stop:887 length:318 start_codon:yes stop_codon:yes gene_type:complete
MHSREVIAMVKEHIMVGQERGRLMLAPVTLIASGGIIWHSTGFAYARVVANPVKKNCFRAKFASNGPRTVDARKARCISFQELVNQAYHDGGRAFGFPVEAVQYA